MRILGCTVSSEAPKHRVAYLSWWISMVYWVFKTSNLLSDIWRCPCHRSSHKESLDCDLKQYKHCGSSGCITPGTWKRRSMEHTVKSCIHGLWASTSPPPPWLVYSNEWYGVWILLTSTASHTCLPYKQLSKSEQHLERPYLLLNAFAYTRVSRQISFSFLALYFLTRLVFLSLSFIFKQGWCMGWWKSVWDGLWELHERQDCTKGKVCLSRNDSLKDAMFSSGM